MVNNEAVHDAIVGKLFPTAVRRSRSSRQEPCIRIRDRPRYEHLGPALLTKAARKVLVTYILGSRGICLLSQEPFVNFDTGYIQKKLMAKDETTDVVLGWQDVEINKQRDERDKVVIGFAFLNACTDSLRLHAICSCRGAGVTDSLFELVHSVGKQYGAQRLVIGSLPHVCLYYFTKRKFRFMENELNDRIQNVSDWSKGLKADDKARLVRYLGNLTANDKSVDKSGCLEGFLTISDDDDPLFEGKGLYLAFLKRAAKLFRLADSQPPSKLIASLAKEGIPMHTLLSYI